MAQTLGLSATTGRGLACARAGHGPGEPGGRGEKSEGKWEGWAVGKLAGPSVKWTDG